MLVRLILSHPEALSRRVKSSGVRQSKIKKGTVLADLEGKGLRKRDGQIGSVITLSILKTALS